MYVSYDFIIFHDAPLEGIESLKFALLLQLELHARLRMQNQIGVSSLLRLLVSVIRCHPHHVHNRQCVLFHMLCGKYDLCENFRKCVLILGKNQMASKMTLLVNMRISKAIEAPCMLHLSIFWFPRIYWKYHFAGDWILAQNQKTFAVIFSKEAERTTALFLKNYWGVTGWRAPRARALQ